MKYVARMATLGILLLALLGGCKEQPSSFEVASVTSPNGSLEAVLTETNGGATTSFGYEISVGTKGAKKLDRVASLYGAIRNEQAYGVNLRWVNDHTLQIQYLQAKAVQNVSQTVNVAGQQIAIELQSGVEDPTAPSGGMHYNLTKRDH